VLVAVNKVDHSAAEAGILEFAELGFEKLLPVSAIHSRGTGELIEAALALLPQAKVEDRPANAEDTAIVGEGEIASPKEPGEEADKSPAVPQPLKLAVVGRPNVGKSSIINALTKSARVIVSPVPGTTRDSVDVPFEVETHGAREQFVLIDTAGMRKARRVNDSIEFFSVKRAEDSIARCDIVIFVLDAESGILEQDKKVADRIIEARKGCLVVMNKWDLYAETIRAAREEELAKAQRKARRGAKERMTTLAEFGQWVQEKLFFLDYAPVIFTSAKDGTNLDRLLEAVRYVAAQLRQKVPTAVLNRTLRDAIERRQPVSASGKRLKFFYATQTRQTPPTFLLFVNKPELFTDAYAKYLSDQLRAAFGFEGCPLVLNARARSQSDESRPAARAPGRRPTHHPARPPSRSSARSRRRN
jgi:GTP-binding protein